MGASKKVQLLKVPATRPDGLGIPGTYLVEREL